MAAFYADENFPIETVEALRRLGHDVIDLHIKGLKEDHLPVPEPAATAAYVEVAS